MFVLGVYLDECLCLDLPDLLVLLGGGVLSCTCLFLILLNCESSTMHQQWSRFNSLFRMK